jgi:hypothetical protein
MHFLLCMYLCMAERNSLLSCWAHIYAGGTDHDDAVPPVSGVLKMAAVSGSITRQAEVRVPLNWFAVGEKTQRLMDGFVLGKVRWWSMDLCHFCTTAQAVERKSDLHRDSAHQDFQCAKRHYITSQQVSPRPNTSFETQYTIQFHCFILPSYIHSNHYIPPPSSNSLHTASHTHTLSSPIPSYFF